MFTYPDANTRGSLGELEKLCEPEPQTISFIKYTTKIVLAVFT